jgi:hypothetical protein
MDIIGAASSFVKSSPTLSGISDQLTALGGAKRAAQDFFGGKQPSLPGASVTGNMTMEQDLRVRIKVPNDYLQALTYMNWKNSGIIFPYTPQISLEHKADYAPANPTHSNYTLNFYKNSSVTAISISGKFTVQNDTDAYNYLSTVHLLRSLTKMNFGKDADALRGAPPPVCRLMAYGDYMLDNVPVAISSFKSEFPENVDYFSVSGTQYGAARVPISSTITVVCIPMYSRQEILNSSVTGWLDGTASRKQGYL